MSRINDALATIQPAAEAKLLKHPLITGLFGEERFTRETYIGYLRETYHLVTHTPLFLAAAASHCEHDSWLCNWFLTLAVEERGHNKLCVRDLDALGEDSAAIISGPPKPGAWMMISQNHFLASHNPVGLIGFAMATEGMGADLATRAAGIIKNKTEFGTGTTAFLDTHGHEDQAHYKSVVNAFEHYATSTDAYEAIMHAWLRTIDGYSQLFTDALEPLKH